MVSSSLLKRTCDSFSCHSRVLLLGYEMSETELTDRLIAEESTDKILAEIKFISEVLTAEHLRDFLKRWNFLGNVSTVAQSPKQVNHAVQYITEPNEKFGISDQFAIERWECKMGMGQLLVSEPKQTGRGVVTALHAMIFTPPPCFMSITLFAWHLVELTRTTTCSYFASTTTT